ncbi:MAG: hypothetical protein IPP06_03215 [Saprospiraceae bacterium]|nr:hypothetical protein [Candidatus Vicinibacter affinis]
MNTINCINCWKERKVFTPDWITEDSPTQRVSSDLSTRQESVSHLAPMLSLDNTYNLIDLEDFDKE